MDLRRASLRSCLVASLLALAPHAGPALARQDAGAPAPRPPPRDGAHDFDFELGTWRTHVRRRLRPLTGSDTWTELRGTTVVRRVWGGKANLVELVADGPGGRFEGLSLRLYDPGTGQWSLHFASSRDGALAPPTVGAFRDGRGEFYARETLGGRPILVRFVISDITPTSCRFEQAFSADGGRTWEVNWIATDTRVEEPAPAGSRGR